MEVKLGEAIKIKHGFAFKGEYFTNKETGLAVLTPANFTLTGGFQETEKFYDSADFPKEYILSSGDLIVTMTDLSKEADTIGYAALVPENENHKYLHNQRIGLVTVYNPDFEKDYIYWLMRSSHYQRTIANSSNGATVHHTSPDKIYKYRFEKKPLVIQKRIAFVLSQYDSLLENNNKRIKVLEQIAENLYKEWFVRFRFPGHENAEFENGIPKGWVYTIVEDLSDILQRGISPDYDDEGELTVISQKCIRQSIMDIKEARKHTKAFKPELNLCDGDTVICSTGTGTLGRVGQVYGTYPNTTFDSHVTLVRAKPTIGRHFLFWALKSMQIWFMNMGIGSTNQQELYRNTIRKAKVVKPGYELINKFDSVIEPIHQEIIKLMKCQDNLIKQRDLLLPRLMSGKLEVKGL